MRHLKASTILVLGALLTGGVAGAAFLTTKPSERTLNGFLISTGIGIAMGLMMFSPFAIAEKFIDRIRNWLQRYGYWVGPRIAFVMSLALGYLLASGRHQTFDSLTLISIVLVFLGASFGVVVGMVNGDRRSAALPANGEVGLRMLAECPVCRGPMVDRLTRSPDIVVCEEQMLGAMRELQSADDAGYNVHVNCGLQIPLLFSERRDEQKWARVKFCAACCLIVLRQSDQIPPDGLPAAAKE